VLGVYGKPRGEISTAGIHEIVKPMPVLCGVCVDVGGEATVPVQTTLPIGYYLKTVSTGISVGLHAKSSPDTVSRL